MRYFFTVFLALFLIKSTYAQTTDLTQGDVAFLAFNLDGTDQFSFVLLRDIEDNTVIKLTDFGWDDANGFVAPTAEGDNVLTWTAESDLSAGAIITVTGSSSRTVNTGTITGTGVVLSSIGDQLFAFQGATASPTILAGVHSDERASVPGGAIITSTSANWSGDDHDDNETSALPDVLSNGVNAIRLYDDSQAAGSAASEVDNWIFVGATTTGTKAELLALIHNLDNWSFNNGSSLGGYSGSFTVNSSAPTSATVAVTVFLEGAYNGTNLNTLINGSIPSAQPYSGTRYNNHAGTESAAAPAGAVDWVLVELREAASAATAISSTKVGSSAGFLMSDGSIKATDGTSNLTLALSGNTGADFYVVIYHRNHLPIMSANTISESGGTYSINFTSASANTYQTTAALTSLSGGKFGMPSGDTDGDGDIDAVDLSTWRSSNGTSFSYSGNGAADFNLDGVINAVDLNDFHKKNTAKVRQVPST